MSDQVSVVAADDKPVRSGAAAFIFVTILLDMLALGLILPILPSWWRVLSTMTRRPQRGSSACSARPGR